MKANSMKHRQVFSLAALLLTILLVLFGCGGGSSGGDTPSNNSGNHAPTATDSAISVDAGATVSSTLSANDADGDNLTYSKVTDPSMGTATIDATTGAFTYTAPSQTGNYSFTFKVSDGQADSNTATVSITVNPNPNQAPVAVAPSAFSANELATVLLDGSGSSDAEDGQAITYSWTQTGGPVQVSLIDADQAAAQFSAPAVESGTNLVLTFKLTVTDSGTLTDEDTVDVTINAAGHIIGTAAPAPYHTNLTQEGALDWMAWGIIDHDPYSFASKDGGSGDLNDFTVIGTATRVQSTSDPVAFSWTDGPAANSTADQTRTRVLLSSDDTDLGEGLRLTVPAGVEDKILKVYLGAFDIKGKVTVRLANDPSVAPYTISLDSPHPVHDAWVVTILFGAASAGDELQFDYTVEEDTGSINSGHINLAAATLMQAQALTPTLSPLPGTYTDQISVALTSLPSDAPIRYTVDGSQPTDTSAIFTSAIDLTANTTINAQASYPGLNSSDVASGAYTIDTTATGTLSATVAPAPYHTDLTQEGTLDWASWGYVSADSFISKLGGSDELSDYAQIGSVNPIRSTGNPVSFSWTDGDPDDVAHNTANQTRSRVYFAIADTDEGEGIRLTIPANDVEKTLRVYLGAFSMEGIVTVSMEDGSTPTYTATLSSPDLVQEAWVAKIDFAAPQGTTSNLIFEFVRGQDLGVNGGHINIAAASLTDQ